jgi:hypothetical protein
MNEEKPEAIDKWVREGQDVQSCRPERIKTKALAPEGFRVDPPDYL